MRSRLIFLLFLTFVMPGGTAEFQALREEDLAPKYREWLDLTRYIRLPQEHDVFLRLSNDRERDLFIAAFWKQRDPTPGTPQNEYREELLKRFADANREFGRGTTRPGWQTDMGKIYIILGPPASRERYDGFRGLHPCEAWYYYGDPARGLPAYFGLLFFKKRGIGEYVLYHQVQDGPAALLVDSQNDDPSAYPRLYQKIKEIAPELAPLSISMVPSEISPDFRPSLRTDAILAGIIGSPRQDVSLSYATHFLNYRGIVNTEYLTNYVDIDGLAEVIRDPDLGIDFVHYSLIPKSVSVDYYPPKDQYYCNYSVDVSLRNGETIIFQYAREFPFYYSPAEDPVVRANGICLQDFFPVCEGKHELTILVRNSVGKEFGVFEKTIEVVRPEGPKISWLLLGCGEEDASPGQRAPFEILGKKLALAAQQTLIPSDEVTLFFSLEGLSEELWKEGLVRIELRSVESSSPAVKTVLAKTNAQAFCSVLAMRQSFPAAELKPGYYEIALNLFDARGAVLDARTSGFVLTTVQTVPRPVVISKAFPLANAFLFDYLLAAQYDKAGRTEKAAGFFEKGYAQAPEYDAGILSFTDFLVRAERFEAALPLAERLLGHEKFRFHGFFLKGRALMGLGKYEAAMASLLEGNAIYDSDPNLLNALGVCYLKTGRKTLARDVLSASLRLNPDQKEIKRLLAELEK